ncbi:Hsk1-interacting molecule 1 [Cercospora zeina]
MAGRRVPLASVPHAANSPAFGAKRKLPDATLPQAKRPNTAANDENLDPRRKNAVTVIAVDKLDEAFRASHRPPTAFEKRLAAVREKKTTPQHTQQPRHESRTQKQAQADNIESIRQWQKHYRRQFPNFVFYFDNVPEDIRLKAVREIISLGAHEHMFFSKAVTHVVTTRTIPSGTTTTSPDEDVNDAAQLRGAQQSLVAADPQRTTKALDANLQRRSLHSLAAAQPTGDARRPQLQGADVLSKARALGTKIWALEKLHRVLDTILDAGPGDHAVDQRGAATRVLGRNTRDADLEQLLRHEKVKGPADRDMTVATQDTITLRGCYLYVHDMDEKTKPVMVRDYSRPQSKEQGKWPQFRLSAPGRCPFVEDLAHAKKVAQQDRDAQEARDDAQRKTRGNVSSHLVHPKQGNARDTTLRRSPRKLAQGNGGAMTQPLPPPYHATTRQQPPTDGFAPFFNSTQVTARGMPRMVRGEPVASGVQPSNVTSAIRSQAVSSAAISSTTGLHRRVGDSREMSMLKRKVLGSNSIPTSHANDVRAAINEDAVPPPRAAKRKAQETLGVVYENDQNGAETPQAGAHVVKRKKVVEKEAKPGYCENCRDKFDDFDDHIASRKHRKFATTAENWQELDELLALLKRPHKKR